MTLFYKAGIFIYSILIRLFSLFNEKAKLFVQGRKNWEENLAQKIDGKSKYIWFHCSSLGEFEQGRPVIEELKQQFPTYKIVLTFFSPSGYEIRKNYPLADIVAYLPMDTKRNAQTFLDIIKPEKAFFVKYEFWYFYISELKRKNIPLYIVSAIFRENQQFFKSTPWGKWYRNILFKVEHLFVQNEKSGELLQSIGLSDFTVSGDTRFDRVAAIARDSKKLPIVEKFKGNSLLIVAGSTWKPDEELLVEFINENVGLKFIIAAHEVSAANINRIHGLLKKPAISFSKVTESEIDKYDVLVIDSVGLLSSLYRYGEIAYIGGGFGVGIHNILEAATFGLPVVFGPNFKRFKEAVDLTSEGGAFSISKNDELRQTLSTLIDDENERQKASQICNSYVAKNVGSTTQILKKVFNIAPVLD
jgi:3-deoxy-D-manno-octulosonic-acid transferase